MNKISIKCLPGIHEQAKISLCIAFSSVEKSDTYEDLHYVTSSWLLHAQTSVIVTDVDLADVQVQLTHLFLFPALLHSVYKVNATNQLRI